MENSVEILKQLLEAGVLTQEEYEAKEKQLLSQQSEEESEKSVLFQSIDFDELRNLEELKDEGILSQDEYSRKAAQICGISLSQPEPATPAQATSSAGEWLKRNVIALIAIVALLGALGFMGYKLSAVQAENTKLQSDLESAKSNERYNYNQYLKAKKSEDAVLDFYLNSAVITSEHDNYYHRYMCNRLDSVDAIWILNPEAAKDKGYTKCPTCFSVDDSSYIDAKF